MNRVKVAAEEMLEAIASCSQASTEIDSNPEDEIYLPVCLPPDLKIPTFDDTAYMANIRTAEHEELNEIFDYSLLNHITKDAEDKRSNDTALANAMANGIKVRSFGGQVHPQVEIFNAHECAMHFHYIRFVHHRGICDAPALELDPEDVDRLYTCGFISDEELDFPLGSAMLGVGVYKRIARQTGQSLFDGSFLPARGSWTVAKDTRPPTSDIVGDFMFMEEARRKASSRHARGFLLPAHYRPKGTPEWLSERIKAHGKYGLKQYAGIDDETVLRLLEMVDPTYISQGSYDDTKVYPALRLRVPSEFEKFPIQRSVTTVALRLPKPLRRAINKHGNAVASSAKMCLGDEEDDDEVQIILDPIPDAPIPPRLPSPILHSTWRMTTHHPSPPLHLTNSQQLEPEGLFKRKRSRSPSPEEVEEGPVRLHRKRVHTPEADKKAQWALRHAEPIAGLSTPSSRGSKRRRGRELDMPVAASPPKKSKSESVEDFIECQLYTALAADAARKQLRKTGVSVEGTPSNARTPKGSPPSKVKSPARPSLKTQNPSSKSPTPSAPESPTPASPTHDTLRRQGKALFDGECSDTSSQTVQSQRT